MEPESLSRYDDILVTFRCREILREYDIVEVEVEIRESVVTYSAGPKLLTSVYSSDPTVEAREPLTTTLGLTISALSTPWVEGTGAFFITDGRRPERLLLVTTRHAIFAPEKDKNDHFEYRDGGQCRYDVTVFGDAGFNKYIESIQGKIEGKEYDAEYQERCIEAAEEEDDLAAEKRRDELAVEKRRYELNKRKLDKTRKAKKKPDEFYEEVSTQWTTRESRIIGRVILSPPISVGVGSEGYTEDWAVIEIDASKVDASNFKGNTINLTGIQLGEFIRKVYPNYSSGGSDPFPYPFNGLLELKGTIPDEEMRKLTTFDKKGDPCLMVIKRGSTTGLTIGRANDVYSCARDCSNDGDTKISKEWTILSFDSKPGTFSKKGDLGSIIVDGSGRIGGLLAGGAGAASFPDLAYTTPINFLLKRMQEKGIHEPNIDLVLTA